MFRLLRVPAGEPRSARAGAVEEAALPPRCMEGCAGFCSRPPRILQGAFVSLLAGLPLECLLDLNLGLCPSHQFFTCPNKSFKQKSCDDKGSGEGPTVRQALHPFN